MAQNQEQIEARLCDYVEGTLTAAERADIEKHLATNPGHRKLIDELMKTRHLVGQLPRVKAPADVSETLQGQLERSVLLGAMPDEHPDMSMRIGFWPRMRAIAAVLILALGLGSIVFFMLRDTRSLPELAKLPPRSEESVAAMEETAPAENAALADASAAADASLPAEPMRSETVAIAPPESTIAATPSAPAPTIASNAFANNAPAPGAMAYDTIFGAALVERVKASAGTNSFRCVVANAPSKDVEGYLERNQIAWTVEPMPEPLSLRENQNVLGSIRNQRSAEMQPRAIEPLPRDREKSGSAVFGAATRASEDDKAHADAAELDPKPDAEARAGGGPTSMPIALATNDPSKGQQLIVARQLTPRQVADLEENFVRPKAELAKSIALDEMKLKDASSTVTPPTTNPVDAFSMDAFSLLPWLPLAAAPTTAPSDIERVDVFIVVDQMVSAPTTAPTSQPAQ